MKSSWTVEYSRILVLILIGVCIGFATGLWVLAVFLPSALYIGWVLYQIRTFERWIRLGIRPEMAPDTSGIWELLVQQIHRAQKRETQQKARLKELLNRFESTISALPYATVTLNEQLEVEWTNAAAADTLGVTKYRDEGLRIDNLLRKPELQYVINGSDDSESVQIPSPVNPDITLLVTCVTFGNNQKLVTAKDISQILAVQKLRKAFIANASHELRTPLTVINGYLEMIALDPELPQGMDVLVDNAHEQAQRMVSILDDLLSLSKLVEKEGRYSKDSGEPVDVTNMLDKLMNDFAQNKPDHTLTLGLSESMFIRGNEPDLFSLCQNLLSNAIKYSPAGAEVRVEWAMTKPGWVGIQFIDNGEGIAREHIGRLTERFYRVNNKRAQEVSGTGLGLSIVKHILENHGGYLEIESELGYGSTFTAWFPDYRLLEGQPAKAG